MGRSKSKGRTARIAVDSLTAQGYGEGTDIHPVTEMSKRAVIPFTMPGDIAEVSFGRPRRGVLEGRLQHLIASSKDRCEPLCKHFGACGGCRLQHVPYIQQIEHKQHYLDNLFQPLCPVQPVVPCQSPWLYRNKMEFSFGQSYGAKTIGLYGAQSRRVIDVEECHLVAPWFSELLSAVRLFWHHSDLQSYFAPGDRGSLRTLTMREGWRTKDRLAMLTVSGNPDYALKRSHLSQFVAAVAPVLRGANHYSCFLRIHQSMKGSPTEFFEMHLDGDDHICEELHIALKEGALEQRISFAISPSAFFQPNPRQAEKLYGIAMQMASLDASEVVYDLYCGAGALGLCASFCAQQVIGIELSPEAALDARTNAALNKRDNLKVITGDVADALGGHELPLPSTVFLDPPRSGLSATARIEVAALQARQIIYVSCNPATQLQDLIWLKEKGYSVACVQPVDQFPQTPHVETVAKLIKNNAS